MEIAQKLAGYTLGNADLLRRAMGKKKKEVLDAEYVPFSEGMKAKGFNEASIAALWGVLRPVLRLRVQQGAHRRLRPGVLLDRLPQGQLPGRVHGRAAHLRRRRQGQVGALPRRVPPDGHQGAAARRQRLGRPIRRGRHRHPVRDAGDPQRRPQRRRGDHRGPRGEGRASPRSATSCPRCPAVVCNKRTIESLIKGGAFDGLARDPRWACCGSTRSTSTPSSRSSARRPSARTACSGRSATTPAATPAATSMGLTAVPGVEWDKSTLLVLRARDARPLRLRPPAVRRRARARRARRHPDRRAHRRRGRQARGLDGDRSPA